MKFTVTKDEFEKFSDDIKSEYTEKDGVFTLTLEGHEDHLIPKTKKDLAEQHRKEAEKALADEQKRTADLIKQLEEAGDSKKAIEEIRKSHEEETARLKAEFAAKEEAAKKDAAKSMIKAEAEAFANKHFTIPSLISKAYSERLSVEEVDGVQVIRVLDAQGKPSVLDIPTLQKEFLANKEFSAIVKASEASGSGTPPSNSSSPGSAKKGDVDLVTANPKDLVSAIKDKAEAGN